LVATVSGGIVAWAFTKKNTDAGVVKEIIKEIPAQHVSYAPEEDIDFKTSAKTAVNQVVHVMSSGSQSISSPFDFIFGGEPQKIPTLSSGSGVIISKDGYVITNNHVIQGADDIEIILNDKNTYKAKIIGRDAAVD